MKLEVIDKITEVGEKRSIYLDGNDRLGSLKFYSQRKVTSDRVMHFVDAGFKIRYKLYQ